MKILFNLLGSKNVVDAREGGANTTHLFSAAHFAKRNTKFGGGGKARAGKNSFPPTPFLFARPSDWISKLGIRIFVKECSNFVQETPPRITFRKIKVGSLGASRLGMVFPRKNPSIFEGERKRPLGNVEVPVRSTESRRGGTEPIFFLSPLAKG